MRPQSVNPIILKLQQQIKIKLEEKAQREIARFASLLFLTWKNFMIR